MTGPGVTLAVAIAVGVAFLATAGVATLRRRYVVVRVEGPSMEPTLATGQRVLVRRTTIDGVRRGQVVVLAFPQPALADTGNPLPDLGNPKWMIKRVVALPGDPVPRAQVPALRDVTETHVPPGRLVLLGDNPASSYDSRRAGYLAADTLLGVVIRTIQP